MAWKLHCLDLLHFRPRTLGKLWRLLRRGRIDIVHWNMTSPLKNPYVWCLSLLLPRLRHFFTDHNSRDAQVYALPSGLKKRVKRFLLRRYEQVWCVSRFVEDCLAAQGTWRRLRCCLHFINTERFRPDPAMRREVRREHAVTDRFVVTVIAQLIPEKGVDVVLRALPLLPRQTTLWIVGTGRQADELRQLAGQLGVQEQVTFWGLQRYVEPFLQASDCFVLPSRWREAAGLVILEAQAAGLPVVCSRLGGIPEYIEENETGFLFASEDVEGLAAKLTLVANDEALRRRMGTAAQALAGAVLAGRPGARHSGYV